MATAKFSTYPKSIHVFVRGRVHRLFQTTIQSCLEEQLDLTGSFTDASWIVDVLVDYTMDATEASINSPINFRTFSVHF
jgi:hypothetical protein